MAAGRIEVCVGPMYASKSNWLINELNDHQLAKDPVLAIRYTADERYSNKAIASHSGGLYVAISASTVEEIDRILQKNGKFRVLGIDEAQFYEDADYLMDLVLKLARSGVTVLACGLDLDFARRPWDATRNLMAVASRVIKKTAWCERCDDRTATLTQRFIDGLPAPKSSPKVLIGGTESYTARCLGHHELPD